MSTDSDSTISMRYDDERPSDPSPAPLSSRQDPFDKLATETIGEIFGYACPVLNLPARNSQEHLESCDISHPGVPNLGILAMVCKRWHVITFSNYSLWATIVVQTSRISEEDWMQWGFLQLRRSLEKSGSYPLDIRINGEDEDVVDSGILDNIISHSDRWRRIEFELLLGREFGQRFNKINGRLPLLEHLELNLYNVTFPKDKFPWTAFLSASKLTSICVTPSRNSPIPKIHIPWAQISCVTFSHTEWCTEKDFYRILECASGALSLTIAQESETEDWPGENPKKLTLSRLRRLRFLHDCFNMLDVLICPSLEELEVTCASEESIVKFLDRSSCALTQIKLWYLDGEKNWNAYHTILHHQSLSTLKSISLSDVHIEIIIHFLDFQHYQLLPLLETLHLCLRFRSITGGHQRILSQISAVRKVVDSRTQPPPSDLSSYEVQPSPRFFLKECFVKFCLAFDMLRADNQEMEESMQALQFFCISRDVQVTLEIWYW